MSSERSLPGADVRAAAARAVARVVNGGLALERAVGEAPPLPPRDAALRRALVSGALRWHHRLEWQVGQLLTRPLAKNNAELAALLRVGLFQLQEMRIPPHAAVSATVDATRPLGSAHARSLVNAVLRRFLRERQQLLGRMAAQRDALYSHPAWLLDLLESDWPDRWRAIADANNQAPPMWLRVNLRQITRAEYLGRLTTAGIDAVAAERQPAAVLLGEARPTAELPGFAEGLVSVQDAAAQLAADLLELAPGQRVLDACAAPGGKTAHILESCATLAQLVALDRDADRLDNARQNLARLGLEATLLAHDASDVSSWWDGRAFDRILIDAPCSAVGVIRRHPDIKVLRRRTDVPAAATLQAGLLDALWPLLEPGGRMVYATCSVLKDENHRQIAAFLGRTPDASLEDRGHGGHYQILPGEANMDGFYYACLVKRDVLRAPRAPHP